MPQENYFNKLKELPEQVRQFGGLIIITLIPEIDARHINSGIFIWSKQ